MFLYIGIGSDFIKHLLLFVGQFFFFGFFAAAVDNLISFLFFEHFGNNIADFLYFFADGGQLVFQAFPDFQIPFDISAEIGGQAKLPAGFLFVLKIAVKLIQTLLQFVFFILIFDQNFALFVNFELLNPG